MKKLINFFAIFVLFTSSVFGQKQKNDWTTQELKGEVKSVKTTGTYRSQVEGKLTKWQPSPSTIILFDSFGHITEKSDFKEDGSLFYKTVYAYNTDTQLIETNVFWADGKPGGKTVFNYDNKGNLIQETNYKVDSSTANATTNKYDGYGNKIETISKTNLKNQGGNKTLYKYDSKGNIIEIKILLSRANDDKEEWLTLINKYDDNGNKVEQREIMPDGTGSRKALWKYDDKGNMTEQIDTGSPALNQHIIWNYEYDKEGNWIKKSQTLFDSVPTLIQERVIEYF